ncbi:MAG: hypothetical protein WBL41_22105, partial [Terracidiphilus sp.]
MSKVRISVAGFSFAYKSPNHSTSQLRVPGESPANRTELENRGREWIGDKLPAMRILAGTLH